MLLTLNSNINSLRAQNALSQVNSQEEAAIGRLSSGSRINSAADDAAGLAITDGMTSQIRGSTVALRNANDGISAMQVADGAMSNFNNALQRIRELAVQSANGTYSDTDRQAMQAEVDLLVSELYNSTDQTAFNGIKLLDGNYNTTFQIGPNTTPDNHLDVKLPELISKGTPVTSPPTTGTVFVEGVVSNSFPDYGVYSPAAPLTPGDLIVNGVSIGATSPGTNPSQAADSAWAVVQAINAAKIPGVEAIANSFTFSLMTSNPLPNDPVSITIPAGAIIWNGVPLGAISSSAATSSSPPNTYAALYENLQRQVALAGSEVVLDTGMYANVMARSINGSSTDIKETIPGSLALLGITVVKATGTFRIKSQWIPPKPEVSLNIGGQNPGKAGLNTGSYPPTSPQAQAGHFETTTTPGITTYINSDPGTDILTQENALKMMDWVTSKLDLVDTTRAYTGAIQNRIVAIASNLQSSIEAKSASRSRIMDTDFAKETAELTKSQIVKQAGTAMLAQANVTPRTLLSLLE